MADLNSNVASLLAVAGGITPTQTDNGPQTRYASLEDSLVQNSSALAELRSSVQAQADVLEANT